MHVTIRVDDRLGLTRRERRVVRVRFCEPVADDLRSELTELARRRGPASERVAERIALIELVIDDPHGEHERITGRLRPRTAATAGCARSSSASVSSRARDDERRIGCRAPVGG
ncbi:MAG: hypothetical protein ACRDLN_14275 [Solirubrobacteraceae bacterium]